MEKLMIHLALALATSGSVAFAQTASTPEELETPPIYVAVRGAVAVPANAQGDVKTGGVAIGAKLSEYNSLGLRVIYMDDPPDNPLTTTTPELGEAMGPVIDWQHHFQPESSISFYTNVSLGYVYGVPDKGDDNNVILPILEGGFGIRLSRMTKDGSLVYMSPELGFVPGAVAPYSALSIGLIRPGTK
jgi:hypothetical protein